MTDRQQLPIFMPLAKRIWENKWVVIIMWVLGWALKVVVAVYIGVKLNLIPW